MFLSVSLTFEILFLVITSVDACVIVRREGECPFCGRTEVPVQHKFTIVRSVLEEPAQAFVMFYTQLHTHTRTCVSLITRDGLMKIGNARASKEVRAMLKKNEKPC